MAEGDDSHIIKGILLGMFDTMNTKVGEIEIASVITDMDVQLETLSSGELFGLMFQSLFVWGRAPCYHNQPRFRKRSFVYKITKQHCEYRQTGCLEFALLAYIYQCFFQIFVAILFLTNPQPFSHTHI